MLKEYNEGCQAGGGIKMASNPKPPNPFEQAILAFNEMRVLTNRIEVLAERFVGPIPTNAQKGETTTPMGCVYQLADDAMRAHQRLLDANAALDRIEAVLP